MSSDLLNSDCESADDEHIDDPTLKTNDPCDEFLNIRSSPPLDAPELEESMANITKKRSHEDIDGNTAQEEPVASSATIMGDVVPSLTQSSQPFLTARDDTEAKSAAQQMPPPQLPRKASTSGQVAQDTKTAPVQTSKPDSVPEQDQPRPALSPQLFDLAESESGSDVPDEPQDAIVDMDWHDLQQRYHDRMTELNNEEDAVTEEFNNLCQYFGVWAQAGSNREVERSWKRLKTQSAYVQHEEGELEEKRQHYIKVVDAFKSALELLR